MHDSSRFSWVCLRFSGIVKAFFQKAANNEFVGTGLDKVWVKMLTQLFVSLGASSISIDDEFLWKKVLFVKV